jgi:signal transduction histidine kinase
MSKKPIDWNLRQKVILHILVVGSLAAVLLFYLYFSMQTDLIRTLFLQKAEMVAAMIDCNVAHHMETGRSTEAGPALSRIATPGSIERLRIIDPEGKILNSSDPDEIASDLSEADRKTVKSLYPDIFRDDILGLKPVNTTRSYIAIPNREECFGCHSPEIPVVGILEIQFDDTATASLLQKFQKKGILIAFAALAVLILIILRLFEKIINRPLTRLKEHMRKIQNGNLSEQMRLSKQDEIGDLTQHFNAMVKKLEAANQEIEELHKQQMERAGHLASLGELAAGLAHEIKNPIAGIKGSLEIIAERTAPEDPKKEIFAEILRQTDRIHAIVKDLLQYAKPKKLDITPTDPHICIQEAINLARPQVQHKEIDFRFHGTPSDLTLSCDAHKLQEVILNLLLNSIDAIEGKGTITVSVEPPQDNEVTIVITDDGKGIKPQHLPQLFHPFFTTRREGTGLGLSITHQIIASHQGRIEVKSEEDIGTAFYIHLPQKRI